MLRLRKSLGFALPLLVVVLALFAPQILTRVHDPLALAWSAIGLLALATSLQLQALSWRTRVRLVCIAVVWLVSLWAPTVWIAAAALALAGVLAGRERWHSLGALIQAATLAALCWQADAATWNAPALGAHVSAWHVLGLLIGAAFGLGILPWWPVALRSPAPLTGALALWPLLRLYQLGPIAWQWGLAGAMLGGTAALVLALRALLAHKRVARTELAERAWWSASLAPALLATEPAVAAVWVLTVAALLAMVAFSYPLGASWRVLTMGAVPPTVSFFALWLGAAAGMAGGMPLLAVLFWLLAMLFSLLALTHPSDESQGGWPLALLALGAGVALPLVLLRLVQPVLIQLGAGLTPFGRMELWPWVGLSVRDAGSRTVAMLPSMVLLTLLLLALATAWLVTRWAAFDPSHTVDDPQAFWHAVRRRLPWLPAEKKTDDV